MGTITLLLVSVGHLAGHVTLFISENWWHCWLYHFVYIGKLVALLVMLLYLYQETGHIAGCVALFISGNWSRCWFPCMVDLLVTLLCISVHADEDLEKYVLETSKLCYTMFKLKCPADTEDEALVGISSEDEAEDMDLDLTITHQAVRQAPVLIVGTSGVLLAEVISMAAATGPVPGPEEVIMKKAALVTVQKQMAALVRGEDLPAREVQDVPYVVPAVGGEDTKCPICHLVFMTPY